MPRPQIELPLLGEGAATAESEHRGASTAPTARTSYQPLWACLHLPAARIEQLGPSRLPRAVVRSVGPRRELLACDDACRAAGLREGQGEHAARALLPELVTVLEDPARERRALAQLAAWALQFGPVVSPEPPADLHLELRGSLKLFGGATALRARMREGLVALGHRVRIGFGPTPSAARLLARAGIEQVVEDPDELPGVLGPLPLSLLLDDPALDGRLPERLRGLGLRSLAELIRLPRDGLGKRYGRALLALLDRTLGRVADPRQSFEPPARFRAQLDLGHEQDDLELIEEGLARLLEQLGGYLLARQCGVQQLRLELLHLPSERAGSCSRIDLALAAAGRDPARLRALFHERLARWELPAPAVELRLLSGVLLDLDPGAASLFPRQLLTPTEQGDGAAALIERLAARLGEGRVQGLSCVAEHRPEAAWRYTGGSGARTAMARLEGAPTGVRRRPAWLLPQPELLALRDGHPWRDGPLTPCAGPERIESGWWDGDDVTRDYYEMRDAGGRRLWVYRERCAPRRWFLHGLFG